MLDLKAPENLCVNKDQIGFSVGEVGTVVKTTAQTSFIFMG